jgi:hypothetical protein
MPSCSASSHIASSLNAISVSQGGSRLIVSIPFVSGLTFGNVIRYDVPTTGFTASKADTAPNSEVFGVIESQDTSTTNFNVVIYGSIALSSSSLADMGSGGGSGGNDIYFLSGTTAGTLQNLAPSSLDQIIKPVYQAAPHGSYTGVITNYLGYRIGGDVQASLDDTDLGNIQIVIGSDQFVNGYVDASISHELGITDYPEFYAKYGTQYGYIEKVTVSSPPVPGSIVNGNEVYQQGSYKGYVYNTPSYSEGYIYIYKKPNTALIGSAPLLINGQSINVSTSSVKSVFTPIITLSQPLVISGKSGFDIPTQMTVVGIKIKPQGIRVSVPTSITTSAGVFDTLSLGKTASSRIDVEAKLNNLDSRLTSHGW